MAEERGHFGSFVRLRFVQIVIISSSYILFGRLRIRRTNIDRPPDRRTVQLRDFLCKIPLFYLNGFVRSFLLYSVFKTLLNFCSFIIVCITVVVLLRARCFLCAVSFGNYIITYTYTSIIPFGASDDDDFELSTRRAPRLALYYCPTG